MLQSFLADDRETFDKVWQWTKSNLKRDQDNLFSWKYKTNLFAFFFPKLKVSIEDKNSATDADSDIAYALALAGNNWGRSDYIEEARRIASDIWEIETAEVNGKRYLIAGNWANEPERLVINPSYFAPYAYRLFASIDPSHDWNKLVTDNYEILFAVSHPSFREGDKFLPPNWLIINKSNMQISPYPDKPDGLDYSYDAFRTFWRVAYDQLRSANGQSWGYVSAARTFEDQWRHEQKLCTLYYFKNNSLECDLNTTGLAGPLAVFSVTNHFISDQVMDKYYIHNQVLQYPDNGFYAKSWHWFATYLWLNS